MKAILPILFLISFVSVAGASNVLIYKNEACGHCTPYITELRQALAGMGITEVTEKEIINDQATRAELARLQERFSVPFAMQGHMVVDVDDKYLFEGHVPVQLIVNFLKNDASRYEKMVVAQDSMGEASIFFVLNKNNEVAECSVQKSIAECFESAKTASPQPSGLEWWQMAFVALIVIVPLSLLYAAGRSK